MSQIHYLRELARTKKRLILFAIELNQIHRPGIGKRNENSPNDIYLKILNEFRALKMTSVIRYKQQCSDLLPRKSQLATIFVLRLIKEKFFLRKINDEILAAGGGLDFKPVIYASINNDEIFPVNLPEKILRENDAAHSMMIDCYKTLIELFSGITGYSKLLWLLRSNLVMEKKYRHNEQLYLEKKIAA
ncbi:hypothetical protein [Kaarinaea lacus]